VNVLGSAPYGYRYVPGAAGAAQYTVHLPEASVVRQIFQWVAMDRISLSQICKKLEKQGVLSPSGMNRWRASSVRVILGNPAYKGAAAYGKTCRGPMRRRPRPVRNGTGIPRGGQSIYKAPKEQWISIAVPALVDESLFDAAAQQLEENRSRLRQRAAGPRHLLQGLLVCKHCGYACCGYRSGTPGKAIYCHYRCTGNQANRFNGQRVCTSPSLRQDALDDAVWNDVRQFLAEPARVEHELQRRLGGDDDGSQQQMNQKLGAQAGKSRRAIARLIDAYEQGLLEKGEFEPRIKSARQQLSLLEEQLQEQVDQQERAREMRLVMDNLETFSRQVMSGLDQADWQTRRDIITTLVKQVEVGSQEVRIVYRVDLGPFDRCPERGILKHCTRHQRAKPCIEPH
jgi:site-specific DNA recombinase